MRYAHGACLEILILVAVEVKRVDTSTYVVRALEDVDSVTRTLEMEGGIKTCHPCSDGSNRGCT